MKSLATEKNRIFLWSFSMLSILFIAGCNRHSDNKAETNFNKTDSLRAAFLTIEDSLVHTWNVMMNDDNKKIKNLKRLVEEVIYAGGVDSMVTQSLLKQVNELKSTRYTSKTMSKSSLIDFYDSSSSVLVKNIIALATSHKEYGRNIVMDELIEEINEADSKTLFHRLDYDDVAKLHNDFIVKNEAFMKEIDDLQNRDKLPIFELPPD